MNKIDIVKKAIKEKSDNERIYIELLNAFGGPISNYYDYLTTIDDELNNLNNADLNKCLALLTMILREDHFCWGTLIKRVENGQVNNILERILYLLNNMEENCNE